MCEMFVHTICSRGAGTQQRMKCGNILATMAGVVLMQLYWMLHFCALGEGIAAQLEWSSCPSAHHMQRVVREQLTSGAGIRRTVLSGERAAMGGDFVLASAE